MGGTTGKQLKKYKPPTKIWDINRINRDRQLKKIYGFKNKRELWKEESLLRTIRKKVRNLIGLKALGLGKEEEQVFLSTLRKAGFIKQDAVLDDVLDLTLENIMDRRLQTIVFKKGLARTIREARQLIVHRHIAIGDRVISSPSYLVKVDEEDKVGFIYNSVLAARQQEKHE